MSNSNQVDFLHPNKPGIYRGWYAFCILTLVLNLSGFSVLAVAVPAADACVLPTWDKSSLTFSGACNEAADSVAVEVCNSGSAKMSKPARYEVWYSESADPKSGSLVSTGTTPLLKSQECATLSFPTAVAGTYAFKAYQAAGHPGLGYLWSDLCSPAPAPICGDGQLDLATETCDLAALNGQVCTPEYGAACTYCSDVCQNIEVTGATCGDGLKNGPEECDGTDGVAAHFTCTDQCILEYIPYCGDGHIDQTEVCELNTTSDCTTCESRAGIAACRTDCSGWGECVPQETCGDGVKNGLEECDGTDGMADHYNCSAQCVLSYQPYCGDGQVNQSAEACDGSAPDHFVCTEDCALVYQPYCGDGMKNQENEYCDGTDGLTEHYLCNDTCALVYQPYCGDGILNQESEQCDGTASTTEHYLCNDTCALVYQPYCGDSLVNQDTETCDLGADNGLTCAAGYGETCTYCSSICVTTELKGAYCGDGVVQAAEHCDGTASTTEHYVCNANCELEYQPYCGDGILNQGNEQCDGTASTTEHYLCNDTCALVYQPYCGDGMVSTSTEQCDDGNTTAGDGCDTACQTESSEPASICGNDVKESGEECDGGAGVGSGQTCTSRCTLESIVTVSTGGGGGGGTPTWLLPSIDSGRVVSVAPPASPIVPEPAAMPAPTGKPNLTLNKSVARDYANPGEQNILYTIIINNIGDASARDVVVTDLLPARLRFADSLDTERQWTIGEIKPGDMVRLTYRVDVETAAQARLYDNIVRLSAFGQSEQTAHAALEIKEVRILAVTGFDPSELYVLIGLALALAGTSALSRPGQKQA